MATAELYDPATGTFSRTGSMGTARYYHTATLLQSGKVLVAGGQIDVDHQINGSVFHKTAEIYDPVTGTFAPTDDMNAARPTHAATLLPSGDVLLVGCCDPENRAELYAPTSNSFRFTGRSLVNGNYTATVLPDGKVLVAGGCCEESSSLPTPSAELYDPSTGLFTLTAPLNTARFQHKDILLLSGKVLVIGGRRDQGGTSSTASAELYDPITAMFSPTDSLSTGRLNFTATLLLNGAVLVAGGVDNERSVFALSSAELYR